MSTIQAQLVALEAKKFLNSEPRLPENDFGGGHRRARVGGGLMPNASGRKRLAKRADKLSTMWGRSAAIAEDIRANVNPKRKRQGAFRSGLEQIAELSVRASEHKGRAARLKRVASRLRRR
jgi:hypothetical protein